MLDLGDDLGDQSLDFAFSARGEGYFFGPADGDEVEEAFGRGFRIDTLCQQGVCGQLVFPVGAATPCVFKVYHENAVVGFDEQVDAPDEPPLVVFEVGFPMVGACGKPARGAALPAFEKGLVRPLTGFHFVGGRAEVGQAVAEVNHPRAVGVLFEVGDLKQPGVYFGGQG